MDLDQPKPAPLKRRGSADRVQALWAIVWRRKILVVTLLLLFLVGIVAPRAVARGIATRALPRLEEKIGRAIKIGQIKVRFGHVDLESVEVDGLGGPSPLKVERIRVGFSWLALFLGHISVTHLDLTRPQLYVVRSSMGDDNLSFLRDRLRGKQSSDPEAGARESMLSKLAQIEIEQGSVVINDEELGVVEVRRVDALLLRHGLSYADLSDAELKLEAGPTLSAGRLKASFTLNNARLAGLPAILVSQGSLTFWRGFTLTGIEGGIAPETEDVERAVVSLRGGYGGVDRVLWQAAGWIRPATHEADIKLSAARFSLAQLKPILEGTPVIEPEQAEVDGEAQLRIHPVTGEKSAAPGVAAAAATLDDAVDFTVHFDLSGLSLFHPMLGPQPVRKLGFNSDIRGQLRPFKRTLRIERAQVDYRGLTAIITAYAEKLGKKPAFDAWLQILPVPCQTALAALPPELTPRLRGFKLQGVFKTEIHLAIDLSELDQGVGLSGGVGIDGCRVMAAPEMMGTSRLSESFDQAVELTPGAWRGFVVGPENPDWVPFAEISPHLVNSIMTTEDSTFLRHRGFIPSEFRSALKANLERGYFRLGASSITMQMVKNVLLSSEKTLSRKLQELFLTWYVERNLTKERILEIYFNAIEFGPDIYGIGRAVRHYFGKPAKDLTPREAAWFSSILPSPKRRYTHFCHGAPDAKWELYLNRILRRMHERGRLTDEEFERALTDRLVFNRLEALPERECLDLVRRLTTPMAGTASRNDEEAGEASEP